MRWLVASALLTGGCDSLFNLDHLEAPRIDSGNRDIDALPIDVNGRPVDAAVTSDAPDANTDNGQCAISYGANRYQFKNLLYSWAMADSYCRSLQVMNSTKYSHLAVVDDQTDLNAIAATTGASAAWVGLTYDSTLSRWNWITAQNVPFPVWGTSEPDGTGPCAVATSLGLDDVACDESHGFVCECDGYTQN